MKKLLLSAFFAFCALSPQAMAKTNNEMAQQVVSRLAQYNVTGTIIDANKGTVVVEYNTKIGKVTVGVICDADAETLSFVACSPLHVTAERDKLIGLIAVNVFNESQTTCKAYIDTDDGQLMLGAWSFAETMPSALEITAMCNLLQEQTVKVTQSIQEEL